MNELCRLALLAGLFAAASCRKDAPQGTTTDFSSQAAAGSATKGSPTSGGGGSEAAAAATAGMATASAEAGGVSAGMGGVGTAGGTSAGADGVSGRTGLALAGAGGGTAGTEGNGGSRSAGCGLVGKPTGDLHLKAKDGAGVMRDYEVLVPATYNSSNPLALTLVYHGSGGTSADAKSWGIQDAPGAAKASIFVFPQGIAFQNYGVGWDDRCTGNDMPLFDNIVNSLEASYCIDSNRVYAGGFSWGCDQVTALACCRGDRIRAVAAASCTDEYSDPANYKTYQSCPVTNQAAIRFTHETTGDSGYPAPLFATTLTLFRSWNECSATAKATTPSPCRTFGSCRSPVVDCPYDNLGHTIPSGWGNDSWQFFAGLGPTNP